MLLLSAIHVFMGHFGPSFYFTICIILLASSIKSEVDSRCAPQTKGFKPYMGTGHRTMLPSENTMLVEHQTKSLYNVSSAWRCGMLCLVHENCMSYNYARTSRVCQLNDADAEVYPCHLAQSDEFGYFQIYDDYTWDPPEVAAECVTPPSTDTITEGHSTEMTTHTEGHSTEMTTQTPSSITTEEIVYGPYNCTLPLSDCGTFWTDEEVRAAMKLEDTGDFNWSVSHIVNGDQFINNNQPCTNILETDPETEPYLLYRMFIHYHADVGDGYFGFCLTLHNSTGIIFQKCTGQKTIDITEIPPMEFLLQGDIFRFSILPAAPQSSVIYESSFDASGFHRYVSLAFGGIFVVELGICADLVARTCINPEHYLPI
ncbi:uncharacterized protein [Amphiura filiformis]|uniref:uncharacterized protein n=1 Tax=Amphiura filiformis TaxID=82378 RepID=UPI003B20CF70